MELLAQGITSLFLFKTVASKVNGYSPILEDGEEVVTQAEEYHSHNTYRLNEKELKDILIELY